MNGVSNTADSTLPQIRWVAGPNPGEDGISVLHRWPTPPVLLDQLLGAANELAQVYLVSLKSSNVPIATNANRNGRCL